MLSTTSSNGMGPQISIFVCKPIGPPPSRPSEAAQDHQARKDAEVVRMNAAYLERVRNMPVATPEPKAPVAVTRPPVAPLKGGLEAPRVSTADHHGDKGCMAGLRSVVSDVTAACLGICGGGHGGAT